MYTHLFTEKNNETQHKPKRRLIFFDSLESLNYDPTMFGILSPRRVNLYQLARHDDCDMMYLISNSSNRTCTKHLCDFLRSNSNKVITDINTINITPYDILVTSNNDYYNIGDINYDLDYPDNDIYDSSIRCDWVDTLGNTVAFKSTYGEVLSIRPGEQIARNLTPHMLGGI